MRWSAAGWVATALVTLIFGTALVKSNQRLAALEAQLDKVDGNFVQLSVPVEDAVRDIAEIFAEIDTLRRAAPPTGTAETPIRRREAAALQSASGSFPPTETYRAPPRYENPDSSSYEMPGADGLTVTQRQEALQSKNGVFNDFLPDEDSDQD